MRFPVLALAAALLGGPAYAQPSTKAIAESELVTLANAMMLVYVDTGYYTTLENLNDVPSFPTVVDYDFINDDGGALAVRPFTGQFGTPKRLDFLNLPSTFSWQGPYITVQANRTDGPASGYDEGTPLDPWGNPYWFYTPVGLVEPITETVSLRFYGDDFSDYRIVSHGPDGQFGGGDDLDRFVSSHAISSQVITSVRISSASSRSAARGSGLVATFKGYNFGTTQGTGGVAAGATPLPVTAWSNNLVTATIGSLPAPGETFTLTRGGGQVLAITGYIDEIAPSAVRDWAAYE